MESAVDKIVKNKKELKLLKYGKRSIRDFNKTEENEKAEK